MNNPVNKRLYVGNLAPKTTAAMLAAAFRDAGRAATKVQLLMSRKAGHSRGFAFVEMPTEDAANAAIATLHGATIDGSAVEVRIADAPKSQFGGRVGGAPRGR